MLTFRDSISDNKGLNGHFLCRIGVADPKPSILKVGGPQLGRDYTLHPSEEIIDMHKVFDEHMESGEMYAMFSAVQSVLGTYSASRLAVPLEYLPPPDAMTR